MMPDDASAPLALPRLAVAMHEDKPGRFPARAELDRMGGVPIVIAGQGDDFAALAQPCEKFASKHGRGAIVNQIAHDDELPRLVFLEQLDEPLLDRAHPPERHEPASRSLRKLIAEVQIGHRQPAFIFMKKGEAPVQKDVWGNGDAAGGGNGHEAGGEIISCHRRLQPVSRRLPPNDNATETYARGCMALLSASCALDQPKITTSSARGQRISKVRTTAYTHTEAGGSRNAIGKKLSGKNVMSAAADWSRWPLGTKFRVVQTDEIFQIDDYGSALIGTGTIDLYKTNRLAMRKWGVRSVDIDVLEWGSASKSLEVLAPRKGNRRVRRMILALSKNTQVTRPF